MLATLKTPAPSTTPALRFLRRGLLTGGRRQIVRRDAEDIGHGYTLVRQAAERLIREMDVEDKRKEIVRREAPPEPAEAPARQGRFSIREILPPYDPGSWPQGFTVSREQIYDDMGRLGGGPEDSSGDGR